MPIRAVVFDLFETLISEYANGVRKVDRQKLDYQLTFGMPGETYRREWSSRTDKRMTGEYADYPSVVRDILTLHQLEMPEEKLAALYQARIDEKLAAFHPIEPSVLGMLRQFKRSGIQLALVSNCTEEEIRGWERCALAPYFDEVLFSFEVKLAKPDKRIYELVCSRLGVGAAETAFVGDGGSNELAGAMEAGLLAVHAVWFVPEPYRKRVVGARIAEKPEHVATLLGAGTLHTEE